MRLFHYLNEIKGPLSQKVEDLKLKLGSTPPDSKEFKRLKKELADTERTLKKSKDSFKGLQKSRKELNKLNPR